MGRGYSSSAGRFGGRSYGGYGTTGDYGYGASGHYGESQFGGGAEEDPREAPQRRRLTPEEYWQRYFAPASYEGRTRAATRSHREASAAPTRSSTKISVTRSCSATTWIRAKSPSPSMRAK